MRSNKTACDHLNYNKKEADENRINFAEIVSPRLRLFNVGKTAAAYPLPYCFLFKQVAL